MIVLKQVEAAEPVAPYGSKPKAVERSGTLSNLADGVKSTAKELNIWASSREKLIKVLKALAVLAFYMVLAILVYPALEPDWTAIDAAYFAAMTMSTVGYGDISPSSAGSRVFTIFMIFFGIVFVFAQVAMAVSFLTAPITRKGREFLEYLMPQIPVDLDGDGGVDYYMPRPPLVYYSKNLLPSMLLTLGLQVVSALIFCALTAGTEGAWTFGDAIYHCLVTATTVGYGDVSNGTQGGRLWAVFHILLSVCMLGELISTLDELTTRRAETLARVKQLSRELDEELLNQLMDRAKQMRPLVTRDGKGLTELEFVLAMIVELEVVQWDQVQPFIKQFRKLDITGDARLGVDDLKLIQSMTKEELKAMRDAQEEVPMSVGDRMGVAFNRAASPPPKADVAKLSVDELKQLQARVHEELAAREGSDAAASALWGGEEEEGASATAEVKVEIKQG